MTEAEVVPVVVESPAVEVVQTQPTAVKSGGEPEPCAPIVPEVNPCPPPQVIIPDSIKTALAGIDTGKPFLTWIGSVTEAHLNNIRRSLHLTDEEKKRIVDTIHNLKTVEGNARRAIELQLTLCSDLHLLCENMENSQVRKLEDACKKLYESVNGAIVLANRVGREQLGEAAILLRTDPNSLNLDNKNSDISKAFEDATCGSDKWHLLYLIRQSGKMQKQIDAIIGWSTPQKLQWMYSIMHQASVEDFFNTTVNFIRDLPAQQKRKKDGEKGMIALKLLAYFALAAYVMGPNAMSAFLGAANENQTQIALQKVVSRLKSEMETNKKMIPQEVFGREDASDLASIMAQVLDAVNCPPALVGSRSRKTTG